MSTIRRQDQERKAALSKIQQENRNDYCADCSEQHPKFACIVKGIFLCLECAGVHRSFSTDVPRIKSVDTDVWTDEMLQFMEENGNIKGNATWAKNVPVFYRRPTPTDPHVLKEQWIRAKYERKEFVDGAPEPPYLKGSMRGYLRKKGKDDSSWKVRLFVLSPDNNSLSYYIKDQDRTPKFTFNVKEINVTFAQDRTNEDNSLQFTYVKSDGLTRNYFVSSGSGKELIDWYMAIRSAKFCLLGLNGPRADPSKVNAILTRDFTMEGFLQKKGPRDEPWAKRWFTLDGRRLLYFKEPMAPSALGEIIIGSRTEGFDLHEGCTRHQELDYCFTLTTPGRDYVVMATTENERKMWMDCLSKVIAQPMTDEDKQAMNETRAAMEKEKKRGFISNLRRFSFRDDDST